VIPKSEEAMKRISEAVSKIFLFSSLDREQLTDVVNAMEEKKVLRGAYLLLLLRNAEVVACANGLARGCSHQCVQVEAGETIIKQGAPGDNFYIIDSGRYEVFKQVGDEPQKKVFEYDNKGSFGELALMYNCPRAATVVAATPGVLWAVDRLTFRHIVVTATAEQRRKYEEFIERVELFKKLTHGERSLIADCLAPLDFDDGAYIIRQGEVGDRFFILERGVTVATQMVEGRGEVEVGRMQEGQFFGERALITNEPRAANVKAVGPVKVAVMERSAFERLLGDCREIMQRQIRQYRSAENILAEKDATAPTESPAAPQPPPEEAQKQYLDASAPTADAAAAAPPAPVEEEKDVETLEH
jgi:cAMP-dependent protein kinase regulator